MGKDVAAANGGGVAARGEVGGKVTSSRLISATVQYTDKHQVKRATEDLRKFVQSSSTLWYGVYGGWCGLRDYVDRLSADWADPFQILHISLSVI